MAKEETLLMKVVREMVRSAGNEIGFEFDESNVDQVLEDFKDQWGIEFDQNDFITVSLMECICETVGDWKHRTFVNCKEQCKGV